MLNYTFFTELEAKMTEGIQAGKGTQAAMSALNKQYQCR